MPIQVQLSSGTLIRIKLTNPTSLLVPAPPNAFANVLNLLVANSISVGNATVNVVINSTSFSGTANNTLSANNAAYLNGQLGSFYTNATNLATGTVPTARLAASGTANSTNFLRGDQVWAVPAGGGGGGSGTPGGSDTQIQFNDSGSFGGVSNFTYDKITTTLSIGGATINSTFYSGTASNSNAVNGFAVGQNLTTNSSVQFKDAVFTGNVTIVGSSIVLQGNSTSFTDNMLFLNNGVGTNITNLTSNGTYVIFTANNNYSAGWDVIVSGVNPAAYNKTYFNIFAANSTTFTVLDSLVQPYVSGGVARGRSELNPDVGFAAAYNDGVYHHTGFFRDATDGIYKIFENYDPEPDLSIYIDTTDPSFRLANFQANTLFLGNTTVNWLVANQAELYHSTSANIASIVRANTSGVFVSGTLIGNSTGAYGKTEASLNVNNSINFNGQPSSFYTNATNITTGILPWAQAPSGTVNTSGAFTITGVRTHNANLFVNTAVLSVGTSTSNVTTNSTVITVGTTSTNVSINSTSFSGTANNATNLGGLSAASYQTTAGLSANVATLTANNATNLGGLSAASYQTTAGLSANVATLTANNATNLGGTAAANYVNTSGAYTITGVHTMNANLFVNTAVLSIGNTTANITVNTTSIVVGNGTVNVSINSTAFGGTANNATNLNNQPATFYTNATNLATGTVPTARLATSGTASSTTFLRGDQVWATPPGGGGGSPGGSTADIQFNDAGAFAGNSNFNYDQAAVRLTVGSNLVNTQINSSSISIRTLIANGQVGSSGQVLTSSGSGANLYWSTPSGGGSSSETVTSVSVNTTLASPSTFYLASGTITLTLPTAVGNSGLRFWIKNNGTGTITVVPSSGQTINGDINMIMTEKNSVFGVVSDGSAWNIY